MKKTLAIIVLLAAMFQILCGCNKCKNCPEPVTQTDLQIAVLSDPHFYDPSLGVTGPAFAAYLVQDRNLIAQSKSINESVIQNLKNSSASIILIPGDLT